MQARGDTSARADEGLLNVFVSPDFLQRYRGGGRGGSSGDSGPGAGSSSGSARGGAGGPNDDFESAAAASQAGGGGFTQAAASDAVAEAALQDVATLSGGEKSVSTLHLLASIAQHCNLPFRAHDEVRSAGSYR